MDEKRWTIFELGQEVSRALSRDYGGPPNERIQPIPQKRTIRYYTSLGILDRPVQMQGRTALYGRRHLLQLVAIKRLQEQGASLSDIQSRLANLGDKQLAEVARLPEPSKSTRPVYEPREEKFWETAPAAPGAPATPADQPPRAAPGPARARKSEEASEPALVTRIRVAPGVELFFDTERAADRSDARALHEAAAPLVLALKSRGLLPGSR